MSEASIDLTPDQAAMVAEYIRSGDHEEVVLANNSSQLKSGRFSNIPVVEPADLWEFDHLA